MKRFLVFSLAALMASFSSAAFIETYQLNSTSYTLTNDTAAHISTSTMHGGELVGVLIDSPSANGSLTLSDAYVSTAVAGIVYSTFAVIPLSLGGNASNSSPLYIPFNVYLSSGLTYTTTNNSGGVTIIYRSFQTYK